MEEQTTALTPKGERTRKRILDTAVELFVSRGYEETTLRDIATAADISVGLTYRYFASKEDLVLALYQQFALEAEAMAQTLPAGTIAERFSRLMQFRLERLTPYRDALGALFSAAMNPKSSVAVLGKNAADVRNRMMDVLALVIDGATDKLREPQAGHFVTILYSLHLLLVLFWLYDRSPQQKASYDLLAFGRDAFGLVRPMLALPPIAKALARLAEILGPVFAGEGMGL